MRLTLVRISPPLQFLIPADRRCDQSPCILAKASCICSGCKGVRASGGCKNNEQVGRGGSTSRSTPSSRRMRLVSEPRPIAALRLPKEGDDDGWWSSRRCASSSDFFTSSPAIVRERTISKARKPTISTVSSLGFRSSEGGRLRNSRNRFAAGHNVYVTKEQWMR